MPGRAPVSERAFHRWIASQFRGRARGLLPLGDDAAALPLGRERVALLTTDALVEWTHFLPESPPDAVGSAAANASLSDLAAKGGTPIALLLDLLVPAETAEPWMRAVLRGADRAVARFGGSLVGGDTKPSKDRAVVGTLFGTGRPDRLSPHGGARAGDILLTTGTVGGGGAAYARFTRGDPHDPAALRRLLTIRPRVREGAALSRFSHAMIDSSDGLSEATRRIAEASRRLLVVEADALPIDPGLPKAAGGGLPPELFFGGDYELLAAVPPGKAEAATAAVRAVGGRLTPIGRIDRGRGVVLRGPEGARPMLPPGWRTFA